MAKYPTFLEQFRSYYFQNNPKDFEEAIEYFSIFGGMGWDIDSSISLVDLIEKKILKNYTYIHGDITKVTKSDKITHTLLSAAAIGDRRIHSALKRGRISKEDGDSVIDSLCKMGFISIEYSLEAPPNGENVADKLDFSSPFIRFWFAFVSPFFKSIKEGDFSEVKERFANHKSGFFDLTFEKLSKELLKKMFKDDPIVEIGSYWDREVEIDVLAKTKSGKIIAGSCKYSNTKANKSELTKLKERCLQAEITPDIFVIFSKSGFSKELKEQKGENLKLYALKNFRTIVEDLSQKDFIECIGKKY